jgi:hypothetical protein
MRNTHFRNANLKVSARAVWRRHACAVVKCDVRVQIEIAMLDTRWQSSRRELSALYFQSVCIEYNKSITNQNRGRHFKGVCSAWGLEVNNQTETAETSSHVTIAR